MNTHEYIFFYLESKNAKTQFYYKITMKEKEIMAMIRSHFI